MKANNKEEKKLCTCDLFLHPHEHEPVRVSSNISPTQQGEEPQSTLESRFREKFIDGYFCCKSDYCDGKCDPTTRKDVLSFIQSEYDKGVAEATMVCNEKLIPDAIAQARKDEREKLIDRAWEYCVKASREEMGSKEELIKHLLKDKEI